MSTITEFRTQFEQMETTDLEGCIQGMCKRYETGAFLSHGFAAGAQEAEIWMERIMVAEDVLAESMSQAQRLVNSVFEPNAEQWTQARRERAAAEKARSEAEMMRECAQEKTEHGRQWIERQEFEMKMEEMAEEQARLYAEEHDEDDYPEPDGEEF